MLIRLLLVVGIVLVLYKILVVQPDKPSSESSPVKESERVKNEVNKSLDQYQDKLNNALKQSGASE